MALDTETSGLFVDDEARVSVVSAAWRDPSVEGGAIVSGVWPFDHGILDKTFARPPKWLTQGNLFYDIELDINLEPADWVELMEWLVRQRLVFQNAKFDLLIIAAGHRVWGHGVDLVGSLHADTMLGSWLLWPLETSSLKPTCERQGWSIQAAKDLKAWLDTHKVADVRNPKRLVPRYDLAPWELLQPYADEDAILTLRLHELQEELFDGMGVSRELLAEKLELTRTLYKMERRGLPFDVQGCHRAASKLRDLQAEAAHFAKEAMGGGTLTRDGARYWFFDHPTRHPHPDAPHCLAIETEDAKTKLPSVATKIVEKLAERNVRGAKEYLLWNQYNYSLSMWYDRWPVFANADDGRIRTCYRQIKSTDDLTGKEGGTRSGRLAVERINLQSIPHDYQLPSGLPSIRSFIKGELPLWELDISQAEMRVAAAVAKCYPLLEAFEQGLDAHDKTTQDVFGIKEGDEDWDRLRAVSKRLNFGMVYAAGVFTIRQQILDFTGIEYPEHQVKEWLGAYRETYPQLVNATRIIERTVRDRMAQNPGTAGYVVLAGGLKRWFKPEEEKKLYKAFNSVIQGSVGQLMEKAMNEVERQHEGIMLLQVHDSIWLETDDEQAVRSCQNIISSTFANHYGIPFRVDVKRRDK